MPETDHDGGRDHIEDKLGCSSGGDPDNGVFPGCMKVGGSFGRIVLGSFDGSGKGWLTAGNNSLDKIGRNAKRRGAFGGIQDAKTSASTSSDIVQVSSRF